MRSHLSTPSIRRKKATSPTRTRPARPRARPSPSTRLPSCAQNFLPNLTQSLVKLSSNAISRHLYVPFTLQRIGQRDNSYRLPAARIPLRFAQCPCTQTAIRAGAVNHPHHINHMNHSSDKCQPALVHALTPGNPSIRRQKGHQPNPHSPAATTRAAFAIHPSAVMRPKFLTQSHTISHNLTHRLAISRVSLVHLYVPFTLQRIGQRDNSYRLPAARIPLRFAQCPCTQTAIRAGAVNHPHHINCANHSSNKCQPALVHALLPVNPSIRRKKATSPTRTRPPRPPARPSPSTRLPSCAQNFLPNLTQSLVISRRTLVHLSCLSTLQPPQKCFQDESRLKPGLCRKIKQLNRGRLAFPSAIRNTKYAIQKSGFPI